jgi:hypothetical protein
VEQHTSYHGNGTSQSSISISTNDVSPTYLELATATMATAINIPRNGATATVLEQTNNGDTTGLPSPATKSRAAETSPFNALRSRHTTKLEYIKAMDLAEDVAEVEYNANVEADHKGVPQEPIFSNTRHPTPMEATHTNIHHTRTKATTRKGPRVQDDKQEEDEGTTGGEKKLMSKHNKGFRNQLRNMDTYINGECVQWYGFISDSRTPIWKNKINALKTIYRAKLELRLTKN